jgi:hypothetical protein
VGRQEICHETNDLFSVSSGSNRVDSSGQEHPVSHSLYVVIPFLRVTSSINVEFPILLGELGRENDLIASKS